MSNKLHQLANQYRPRGGQRGDGAKVDIATLPIPTDAECDDIPFWAKQRGSAQYHRWRNKQNIIDDIVDGREYD